MQMNKYCFVGFLVVVIFAGGLSSQTKNATITLEYKPRKDGCYLWERTFEYVEDSNEEDAERIHQRAVIEYGESTVRRTGMIRFAPEVHLLNEDGKGDHIQSEFWPVRSRFPTGEWTDSWRWSPWVMLRDHDLFPIFPKEAVKVGDSWDVNGKIGFAYFEGESQGANGAVTHAFEAIEPVEGVNCARIRYRFSVPFETIRRFGEAEGRIEYTVNLEGAGTVHFDFERGVVVRQDFSCRVAADWQCVGKPDEEFLRTHRNWDQSYQYVVSSKIASKLISKNKAAQLVKEAEAARAKQEAAKSVQPVEEKGPRWKYFLERTTIERNDLLKKNKERVFTDRAFVYFGAGAKQAGGQLKDVPNVVYVNEKKERLPKASYHAAPIVPIDSKKLTLIAEPLEDQGATPESPLALQLFLSPFLFPLGIETEMTKGLSWSPMIYASYPIGTGFTFPVQIKCRVAGHKVKKGRRCAVIKYSLFYEFKMADHPELFTQDELRRERGKYMLKGDGTVYFDPTGKMIVEQRQTVSFSRRWEGYEDRGSGKARWSLASDEESLVKVRISLESD